MEIFQKNQKMKNLVLLIFLNLFFVQNKFVGWGLYFEIEEEIKIP